MHQTSSSINHESTNNNPDQFINQLLDYAQNRTDVQNINSIFNQTLKRKHTPEHLVDYNTRIPEPEQFIMRDIEWFHCLREFITGVINDKPHIAAAIIDSEHECTSDCHFFNYKPMLYICKQSGFIHICSSKLCNRLLTNHDNRVCELTCFAYPLDTMEHEFSMDNEQQQNYAMNHTRKKVKTHNKKTLDQIQRETLIKKELKKIEKEVDSKLTITQRQEIRESFGHQRIQLKYDKDIQLMECMQIIKTMFKSCPPVVLDKLPIISLSRSIVDYWVTVNNNLCKDSKERAAYIFKYHVYACLYIMANNGYSHNNEIIIPYNALIDQYIPMKKYLHKALPNKQVKSKKEKDALNINRITAATKMLKKYLIM